ncbi:hypothetical protein M378DRAFT_656801 [Amanita muscaria Koide BX008]|uniref:Uncharacterized protein n=1 Tax=Amanita muscaria (strain Koide BX008) TaxID=946122 RepID=A0A0C2X3F8_AMAMK|nr:hypothetical protein M378DRAFT_656801 [Amanita muscaria Koide BX008]
MRDLQLHLVILQRISHHIAAASAPGSDTVHEAVTEWTSAQMTEATQNIPEKDLESCLSELLSCPSLRKTNSLLAVNTAMVNRMTSLLAFNYIEIATRVRSASDAQRLIDLIDLVSH